MIITQKKEKLNTIIKIDVKNDIGDEFGNSIPYPSHHYIDTHTMSYYYFIDGFFHTKKGIEYINDVKARFLITFKDDIKAISHYKTDKESQYKLKDFGNLKSIAVDIINKVNRYDGTKDFVFWCLKLYAEKIITERGLIQYDTLLDFGYVNFKDDVKDNATLKSKCRSIVKYYIEKDYQLDKYVKKGYSKELRMTRAEHIKEVHTKRTENTKNIIKNFLSGLLAPNYKFKSSGKWNTSKIAKDLKLNRKTVIAHLKDLEEI